MSATEVRSDHLADPASGWSIGASGVLAEFMRDAAEPCERDRFPALTARGAIRVDPNADLAALAYEVLSAQPGLWHHGVLFSRPAATAALPVRTDVTEVGPDRDAIGAEARSAVLFDLGLGLSAFAFSVRTSTAALLRTLRHAAGGGFLAAGPELAATLVAASPHRVAISRVARIEVYQPSAAEGGATPSGPHTHLIPRLLRVRRDVSANIPLAPGRLAGLTLYPPHPAKDEAGARKPFSHPEHAAFQRLLAAFGDPSSVAAKYMSPCTATNNAPGSIFRESDTIPVMTIPSGMIPLISNGNSVNSSDKVNNRGETIGVCLKAKRFLTGNRQNPPMSHRDLVQTCPQTF